MSDEAEAALRSVALGDLSGLECLYVEMRTAVFATALAITRDSWVAEDVLQDTFVRVAARAGSYRPATRPRAWILAIARNLALDALRRSHRATRALDRPNLGRDTGTDVVVRSELVQALLQVGEIDRQIVVLHAIGGLTHAEIATELAMPAGTVRWKYRAALVRLRGHLEGSVGD